MQATLAWSVAPIIVNNMISIRPSQAFATTSLLRDAMMLRRADARQQPAAPVAEVEPHSPLKFDPPTPKKPAPAALITPQLPRTQADAHDTQRQRDTLVKERPAAKLAERVLATFELSSRGHKLDARV